jgi:hypothetical protein
MAKINLGKLENGETLSFSADKLSRHMHLIGTTGAGKTTALHTIFHDLLKTPYNKPCMFIVDPLGGLSRDLLMWFSDKLHCPNFVRKRVVYIEPANDQAIIPFNPLEIDHPRQIDFRIGRAVEVILRAWDNQNVTAMPRLYRWLSNSLRSVAHLGLPLSFANYLIYPESNEFSAIVEKLPASLQHQWSEIQGVSANQLSTLLESTRNRLQPFTTGVLKDTFAINQNHFDVKRFIENRNIVIVNLAGFDRLSTEVKRSYGSFVVNQVVSTVRSMVDPKQVDPTYLVLDEFQEFVTNDLVDALPQLRQFGLRMVLAHQSFSQLKREDIDLSSLIWLAQNRVAFANSAEDADILAHEFGTLNFDPNRIKHAMFSTKQLHDGYEKVILKTTNQSKTKGYSEGGSSGGSSTSSKSSAKSSSSSNNNGNRSSASSESSSSSTGKSSTWSSTYSSTESETEGTGYSESFQAKFKTFEEETSRTYSSYEEQQAEYGRDIRRLKVGYAYVKLLNDPNLHYCKVRFDPIRDTPRIQARVEEFKQQNFENNLFLSPAVIGQKHEELRMKLLKPEPIILNTEPTTSETNGGPRFN